ncbi:unnamed protein product, partial [Ranitomeya imitator]
MFYTITIEIQDVNDNSPIFSKKKFDIEISELTSPGARFALGNAKDADLGTNSIQGYTLSSNEHFTLGEKNTRDGLKYPEIILEKSLDREKQSFYDLILTAFDGGEPPKTGTAIIKIIVQDDNDNFPIFTQDTYNIKLSENVPIGFLVVRLNATDEDEGSNALITYAFSHIPEDAHDIFSIDSLNGEIKIIGTLDYEVADAYEMTVEAKDGGSHVTHCKVSIQVMDVNDNAPEIIITTLSTSILEESPPGTVIAIINFHDRDSGINGEVYCMISDTSDFQLVPSSSNYYKLVTAANMDREKRSIYNTTLKCVDNGSPPLSSSKVIELIVSDVNDNVPVFDKRNYIVYIAEHSQPGISIQKVHATDHDSDENGKVTYSIQNKNIEDIPVTTYVSINSMTGVIYAQRSFDYEQLREFQFQVMAKDSGSPPLSSNVTVRICIIDKNDNAPKILYPSPDTEGSALFEFIPHSAEKGYLVTKVIAVDADSGHNAWLSYHLLQVPDPSLFTIGQYTGEIRIVRDLQDTDTIRQKLVVLVKDNGAPSLSSTVTLTLVVADNFQQVVPEIRKQLTNSDTKSPVTFYLVISIALISCLFITTVIITVIYKCRKDNTPTTYGHIAETCKPSKTGTATIKVTVIDVNDNFPKFDQDRYRISLPENAPIGFLVTHLKATDEDEGLYGEISYSFNHITKNADQIFSLDSLQGDINTIGTLDYEVSDNYEMTVEAKDGGGLVTHCKVSIQVIDVNDNAPDITVTTLATTILEDSPPGTIIAIINVRDVDSGQNGEVVCQILDMKDFQLLPSSSKYYKLVTASSMDRERNSLYNVTIHCTDKGSPPLSTNKTIPLTISDVNDNAPIFDRTNYVVYIMENNQPGHQYKIFLLQILIKRSFDYEQLREFQFQVMAKDSGSPPLSSNVTVRICIIDKNDNAPKILYPSPDTEGSALFEFIPHSAEKGYLVTKVIAVDADSGHNAWLSYHLLQVPDPSLFGIGQYTGEIKIVRDLQDADNLRQKLVVLVKDNGAPSLSSTVTLSLVVAENFQQVVPEIRRQPTNSDTKSPVTFYLVISIALISCLFIITVIITVIYKCRKDNTPTSYGPYSRNVYPQFTLGCPSEISDTSLPFPFSYDVCVTLDSKQNEIAYLKPVQNVPTENLIDTEDSAVVNGSAISGLPLNNADQ